MSDAVARTKADPNRSYREDELVYEIERLRAIVNGKGRDRLFPAKFTLTIEEHATIGWIVTSDAHKGFLHAIMPEEGLPEGLRKVPESLRLILVVQMDEDLRRKREGITNG